jgi:2-amino-4-hydroxy-6-hydroxymethyldihydropteridine diphosphokinase
MPLTRVFLGLGSNIEREAHLVAGLDALAGLLSDMRCSPVFESHAVGIKSGNFFNLVVVGETELPLLELDRRLKFIEADNGRYAPERKGLPLDIDVLLYGEQVGNYNGLILPRAENSQECLRAQTAGSAGSRGMPSSRWAFVRAVVGVCAD